jgi:hypothetical protein
VWLTVCVPAAANRWRNGISSPFASLVAIPACREINYTFKAAGAHFALGNSGKKMFVAVRQASA